MHSQYVKYINIYRTLPTASADVILLAIEISVHWEDNINFGIFFTLTNEIAN